ncbi:MAG TPA: DegV family protein [Firmicutes bacterium]|nr:DegV family protein [Bacillota bacterium]
MIRVVTDSTADIPEEILKKENISSVPLRVFFGDDCYLDWEEMTPAQFYENLVTSEHHPRTSQPSPDDFKEVYQKIAGPDDEIISIHISQHLSGTIHSANAAGEALPNLKINIYDSELVSMGMGIMVVEVARAANRGAGREEIEKIIEHYRQNVKIYFFVDTLRYMYKSGRIGRAKALFGSMLNIKPLLTFRQGIVTPLEQVRGQSRALKRMLELIYEDFKGKKSIKMALVNAADEEGALKLKSILQAELDIEEVFISAVGSVIGTHSGPGVLGVILSPAY